MTRIMRAIQFSGAGGAQVVEMINLPVPQPRADEMLLRVHAASVNTSDWKVRAGLIPPFGGQGYPASPGWDVSGVIVAVGDGVEGFEPGDAVVAVLPASGAYADFVIVSPTAVARKPSTLSHVEAAVLPAASTTAYHALFHRGGLTAGQRVLIHAASGGVGHLAVQLAKDRGAHVIGTTSSANLDFVRSLGAEIVVDYRADDAGYALSDVDIVVDLVGGAVEARSWSMLKQGGIIVSAIRTIPAEDIPEGKRGCFVAARANSADLATVMELAAIGKVIPCVRAVFPLADAGAALELSESGHGRGRIIIEVAP